MERPTPHEAVTEAISDSDRGKPPYSVLATAAIEALRKGAVERANSVVSWSPATERIINAILGPPNDGGLM